MPADPQGAADTGPGPDAGKSSASAEGTAGWLGRNGARWARAATGPTPGPPPPWGMQNVLWRLRWLTAPPNQPGRATPTKALRVAPSTKTWPPRPRPTPRTPAITAEAALVPWADAGIRHTSRGPSPRLRWYSRMASSPASSPCEPALGWSDTAS